MPRVNIYRHKQSLVPQIKPWGKYILRQTRTCAEGNVYRGKQLLVLHIMPRPTGNYLSWQISTYVTNYATDKYTSQYKYDFK